MRRTSLTLFGSSRGIRAKAKDRWAKTRMVRGVKRITEYYGVLLPQFTLLFEEFLMPGALSETEANRQY